MSRTLPRADWEAAAAAHAARADALTVAHRERRSRGEAHPVEDFLFTYYPTRPSALARWHPGVGVRLADARSSPYAQARWYVTDGDGAAHLDPERYLADRGGAVTHYAALLRATARRRVHAGCFGLHEWAMTFRERRDEHRHPLPLRLGEEGTDAVVESHRIACTHYDAFRFFTPDARPRNVHAPTRDTQLTLEQPGCLHANMDLYRVASKLGPAVPGDVLLVAFELAREIRELDMRASPYDLTAWGYEPVEIETPAGKAAYVAAQRSFAARAQDLRGALLDVCAALGPLDDDSTVSVTSGR